MYSLSFDTTGAGCGIILQRDEQILDRFERSSEFGQAEMLLPAVREMLDRNNLSFAGIDALFVCVGPGSFTGVRSGVSAARVLGFARPEMKVGGVSAFDAYCRCFAIEDIAEINAVIIETRRDDFYVQFYDDKLCKTGGAEALPRDEIIARLKGRLVSLAGDGVERFLSTPSGLTLHAIKMFDHLPVEALAAAGLKQLAGKKLNYPKPLYLRAPDVTLPRLR